MHETCAMISTCQATPNFIRPPSSPTHRPQSATLLLSCTLGFLACFVVCQFLFAGEGVLSEHMDRKRKADDMATEETGGKNFKRTATDSPPMSRSPHNKRYPMDAVITIGNVVLKGYHHFQRKPLPGLDMDVVREYDNPYDRNAYIVRMPQLGNIPADMRDVVTDARRGTTVRSIAGQDVGRLPAGLAKVLAELDRDGVLCGPTCCAATAPPCQSFPPWPVPHSRGGGAVIPADVYLVVDARDKDDIVGQLREAIDRHMSAVKTVITIR
ncbi:uncharacterized protein LOC118425738 isoform X1 [Branchiostoma floridae]|uniref:Uncharacterized protein LOC118425738 isoform X1 n=2 Tax=Branchiostoma floridae TaxID=7739 RepID=A0A9J7N5H5_BRAFL|nr:uncharacterized protein LOC118425738 isoform X1 [Branchiostoma floridae]